MTRPKSGPPEGADWTSRPRRGPRTPRPTHRASHKSVGCERHETPDPVRLNALDVQFHNVRGGGRVARQPSVRGQGWMSDSRQFWSARAGMVEGVNQNSTITGGV